MSSNPLTGYLVVFAIEAAMLLAAAFLLMRIDVKAFRDAAMPPPMERAAMIE